MDWLKPDSEGRSVAAWRSHEGLVTRIVEQIQYCIDISDVLIKHVFGPEDDLIRRTDARAQAQRDVAVIVLNEARIGRERRVVFVGPRPIDASIQLAPAQRVLLFQPEVTGPHRRVDRTLATE